MYFCLIYYSFFQTWHDIRSKIKKKQAEPNGKLPISTIMLSAAEQDALGIKVSSLTEEYQDTTEFVPLSDNQNDNFKDELSEASMSEPESLPETKVFNDTEIKSTKLRLRGTKQSSKHTNNCFLNCDLITAQEQKKIQMKEDYLNFKKDYLKQKLKLLKEQTEALKSIAKELSK